MSHSYGKLISLFGIILILSGCSLDAPGPPVWTIEATIPFSERTYRLSELVSDSSSFSEDGWGLFINGEDSVLSFEFEDSLEYQQVGDRLTYDESDRGSYVNDIGLIVIEEPLPDADSILVSDANPDLTPGYFGPVPAFNLGQAQDTLIFNIFSWVRVSEGEMNLTIKNGYPFDLADLVISLSNMTTGEPLGQAVFPDIIPPDESAEGTIDLDGRLVRNEMIMRADGRSPGTGLDFVNITGNENMVIFVGISETSVDSANAEIAEQTFAQSDAIVIEDDNKIQEANIKSGAANFVLSNTTKFELIVDMTFEDIFDASGEPLTERIVMNPEVVNRRVPPIDLSGKTIRMDINNQELRVKNHVTVVDTRETLHNGVSYQTIAGYQGVEIEYWTDELILSSLAGRLNKIEIEFPEESTEVDLPQGLDSLNLTSDTLFINLNNETTMPVKLNLEVSASNSTTGESAVLPVDADLLPGKNTIVLSDVDRLTEVIPDKITVNGQAGLGVFFFPAWADSIGTVTEDDGFAGDIRLKSDLRLTIGEMEMVTDPVELEEELDFPIENISVRVHLSNLVKLGGFVKIMMGADTTEMDTLFEVPILASKRADNPPFNFVPAETTFTIDLGPTEMDIMRELPLYTQQAIKLFSTLGNTINLHAEDALSVQASATVFYTIDPNDEEDK